MRVSIRPRNMTADQNLRSRIDHCLQTTLDPVRGYLQGIDVYLTDVNGPRGGPDKQCRVVAHVPAARPVVVSRTGRDPVAAVARAAAVCRRSVRTLAKRRRART
jgi:putative sigma-54 modulation protein